jgi:alcohol-forming fatty acyl-CoA reductase
VAAVSIVFHSAATVKFDEALTKSVAMNVGAVLSIINLCKKMQNLEVRLFFQYCEP